MDTLFNVKDGWAAFYLFCAAFGLFFTVISFVFGLGHNLDGAHGGGGHGGHNGGHGGHGDVHGDSGVHFSPINISTIMIFLSWFGISGYLIYTYTPLLGIVVLGIATLIGLVGGAIVFFFITRFLLKTLTPAMKAADYDLSGRKALVSSTIFADGIGEVAYTQDGYNRSAPARSVTGQRIDRGAEVVILRYERDIAYVRSVEEILNSTAAEGQPLEDKGRLS